MPSRPTTLAIAAIVLATACSPSEAPEAGSTESAVAAVPSTDAALAVATDLGVRNARMPMPGLITAGQPTQAQLDALRGAGVQRFVSFRPTSEDGAGWEEAHAMDAGYDFDRIPIAGAGSLSRENVEAFASILQEAGEDPMVVYCASSNRVGAMLALKAHWIDGVAPEEALALGRSSGLASLEGSVRELMGLEPGQP